MATRSRIGIANPQGNITSIYCHFDGYPWHIGRLLHTTYNTEEDARKIVALGDLSCLDDRLDGGTVAYGRDRGEEGTDAEEHTDEEWPDTGQEFLYLWMGSLGWHYREERTPGWRLLTPASFE